MPDTQILPDLSVLLGVTIDELFALTDDTHFERIKNMIYNQHFMSKEDFIYAEKFLKEKLNDVDKKFNALTLLAELHIHRSNEHRELAAQYAKDALTLNPYNKATHNAFRDAENGVIFDWNFSNRHKLIKYYKDFVSDNPDYWEAYKWHMNYLIEDGRTLEAREILEKLNKVHPGYLHQLYGGLIFKEEGNISKALLLWEEMTELYPDEWRAWSSRGDCMAKLCRYDEAVKYYTKGYQLQPHPKYTDSLEAIYHIYEIQGMKIDWKTTDGKTVDFYKKEIHILKIKLYKQK